MNATPSEDKIKVLVVDDEPGCLKVTEKALSLEGCEVVTAKSAEEAMERLETRFFDVVVSDVKMPGMGGLELLRKLAEERPTFEVVMISGHADAKMAIEVMKLGAFDFLLKPLNIEDLSRAVGRAARHGRLQRHYLALEQELARTKGLGNIVGESDELAEVRTSIKRAAASDIPVLITGESGTGKELVAQAIHTSSRRCNRPLVVVDGSTLRTELLASELFGHEKGAFTGAASKKPGLFEVADKGSVFLDEIAELSADNQAALLRVLETGVFRPVGSVHEIHTDVRIIAATNQNIQRLVEEGGFREDLYYRLKGFSISIPPLRERTQDIPLIAEHFLTRYNVQAKTDVKISAEALRILKAYSWPGNVRELRHTIELSALLATEEEEDIEPHHLPEEIKRGGKDEIIPSSRLGWRIDIPSEKPTLADFKNYCERAYISRLLKMFGGNKAKVGRVLGISPSVLYSKLRKLGLMEEDVQA
jgi:DNA-binding NtrC family response regulator